MSAALKAQGYEKTDSGGWKKDSSSGSSSSSSKASTGTSTSSSSSSKASSGTSSGKSSSSSSSGKSTSTISATKVSGSSSSPTSGSSAVALDRDYHQEAIDAAARGDWAAVNQALAARQQKINAQGGNDRGTSNQSIYQQLISQYGGSSSSGKATSSGGSTSTGSTGKVSSATQGTPTAVDANRNYHQEAIDAAARGDWAAVNQALAARQQKINAQGGNDRGTSTQQIYQQLLAQYGSSPSGSPSKGTMTQDEMVAHLYAGNYVGDTGNHLGKGWEEGRDYLAEAMEFAKAGNLTDAYTALAKRGYKMADTGSTGNGTSQAQAYQIIHQLFNQSGELERQYGIQRDNNTKWLEESGATAGNPSNAYKTLLKNGFWVTYDGEGNPVMASHAMSSLEKPKYTKEEIDLTSSYLKNGFDLDTYLALHNMAVDRTGIGTKYGDDGVLQLDEGDFTPQSLWKNGVIAPGNGLYDTPSSGTGASETTGSTGGLGTGTIGGLPTWTGSGSGSGSVSGGGGSFTPGSLGDYLDQWLQAAQQQQTNTIDWGTSQAVNELVRAQQEAEEQYQTQRNQIAIDEAKAKDNQALYAEARGDKGGIGAAQYDTIMNTAAQNRLSVNSAQTKLASDTARQIADLRAQGEYEKADALLQLTQTYLSQLISLEQWSMEYNLSVAQFNASLEQWAKEYDLKVADLMGSYNGQPTLSGQQFAFTQQQYQDELNAQNKDRLASAGETLLAAGIMPSDSQLDALGLTKDQAQTFISAMKAEQAASASKGSSSGSGSGSGSSSSQDYDGLFAAAKNAGSNARSFISNNYKKYGFTSSTGLWDEYQEWLEGTKGTESLGSAARGLWNIIRQLGDSPATAQKRIESYASDGRITEEEEAILLRMILALAGE